MLRNIKVTKNKKIVRVDQGFSIIELLERIPDYQIRRRAIRNCKTNSMLLTVYSLSDAIATAFNWMGSPEGGSFWQEVTFDLHKGKLKDFDEYCGIIKNGEKWI